MKNWDPANPLYPMRCRNMVQSLLRVRISSPIILVETVMWHLKRHWMAPSETLPNIAPSTLVSNMSRNSGEWKKKGVHFLWLTGMIFRISFLPNQIQNKPKIRQIGRKLTDKVLVKSAGKLVIKLIGSINYHIKQIIGMIKIFP